MKKFSVGLIAIALSIGAVAFTEVNRSKATNYFWYKRTGTNTYVDDRTPNVAAPSPVTSCSGSATICVKGFTSSQTAGSLTDATAAQQQQMKTP